jgi:hypothetical protein
MVAPVEDVALLKKGLLSRCDETGVSYGLVPGDTASRKRSVSEERGARSSSSSSSMSKMRSLTDRWLLRVGLAAGLGELAVTSFDDFRLVFCCKGVSDSS